MAFVNFATREITAKIVYYGSGLGGKTTSLQYIHNGLPGDNRGKMISLATEEDRTIYFDFLPLNLGKIQDFAVRVQLYTVPGQVRYNATRKLVLRGADGLVFVADSQKHKKLSNLESFHNMEENLREHGKDLKDLPHILQFNKIDLPNRMSAQDLNSLLNKYNVPFYETCATLGIGILEALKNITKLVFNDLGKKALLQKKTKGSTGPLAARAHVAQEAQLAEQPAAAGIQPTSPAVAAPGYFAETKVEASEEALGPEDPEPQQMERGAEDDSFSSVEPAADENLEEVSSDMEFEEVSSEEIEYPSAYPGPMTEAPEPQALSPEFSYDELLDGPAEFKTLMERLEHEISEGQNGLALINSRAAYTALINELFPREYFVDGNEASIMLALNVKFKRYRRFRKLLDSETIRTPDLLFLHHFLCDLYLSIREL
jgi:signal recognition particle receptor subunit beta